VAPQANTTASCEAREHLDVDVLADDCVGAEFRAFGLHLLDAPVDVPLLHLELGDAVPQESTDPIRTLEHDDVVARSRELLRDSESGGAGSDDGDALAGADRRDVRRNPAFVPRAIDDLDLDLLDRHRVLVDAEHARRLARRRAQPTGELREVVRGVQPLDRVLPMVSVDEIVPVGNQISERAAVVAERDAAVHAATGLMSQLMLVEVLVHLLPVAQSHRHGSARWRLAFPLQKPGRLTHEQPP
jgi:hypothetical protein